MGPKQRLDAVVRWARRAVAEPVEELGRWQRVLRWTWALCLEGRAQLVRDDAPAVAGALAFRTLFALFPLIIVGSITLRAFIGVEGFHDVTERLLVRLLGEDLGTGQGSLGEWLLDLSDRAEGTDLKGLGWLGSTLLVYSALSMLVTIENAFQRVCHTREGRSWWRRIPIYWAVLTLGPLAVGLLVFVNGRFVAATETLPDWVGLLSLVRVAWGFAITWLVLLGLYRIIPVTSLPLRALSVGAFVAALLVGLGKTGLAAYLEGMQTIRLWASVGFVPLFMFWLYLMWLVVLFGLQVAAMLSRVSVGETPRLLGPSEPLVEDAALADALETAAARLRRRAVPDDDSGTGDAG